jgi:hypothetical protein
VHGICGTRRVTDALEGVRFDFEDPVPMAADAGDGAATWRVIVAASAVPMV